MATGRRKSSTARVNLKQGTGSITINGKEFEEYFTTAAQRSAALKPLLLTETHKDFDIQVRSSGGGLNGQAGAVRLAISRALIQTNETLRPKLKAEGLLTRDPRKKERKKSGQPGARKRFQFSKR